MSVSPKGASTAGREVTPSKSVDEVRRIHILHTKFYFDEVRRDTFGFVLHHDPGEGSPADARFEEAYIATLELCEKAFGVEATSL